jgi:3-hydroxyisobutyrate dehydrogenase
MTTIAFIGLGAMGLPMAENLHKAGHDVTGFDINPVACAAFEKAGGRVAATVADAARGAEFVVVMVVNADQADDVLFARGAAEAMAPEGVVILTATCAPARAEGIAAKLQAMQRGMVDAPVSGGVGGARSGSLTIMASAPDRIYARAEPALQVMGSKLVRVGDRAGQGAMVKTINQLLCGVHIAAAAEAMALAEQAGLNGKLLLDIFGGSAASSWMLNNRGPRMIADSPEVMSAVDIFVKDLGIVLDAGRAAKMPLLLSAVAHQLFLAASGMGLGRADDSQVIAAYRALTRG